MKEEDKHILFREKLLGLLDAEGEQQFEEQAASDPAFVEEFRAYQTMAEVVMSAESEALKSHLQTFDQKNRRIAFFRWSGMAAAILLLIVAYPLYDYLNRSGDLYGQYFNTYPNALMPTTRAPEQSSSNLEKAFYYYDRGMHQEAHTIFEAYLAQQADEDVAFYYAVSLMYLGKLPKATKVLEGIVDSPGQSDYQLEAKWYLALCYIQAKKHGAALALLRELDKANIKFKREETDALIEALE